MYAEERFEQPTQPDEPDGRAADGLLDTHARM